MLGKPSAGNAGWQEGMSITDQRSLSHGTLRVRAIEFIGGFKQVDQARMAAFSKRLASASMGMEAGECLGSLGVVRQILASYPRSQSTRERTHRRRVPDGSRRSRARAGHVRRLVGPVAPPRTIPRARRRRRSGEFTTERCHRPTTGLTRTERARQDALHAAGRLQPAHGRAADAAPASRASRAILRRRLQRRFRRQRRHH